MSDISIIDSYGDRVVIKREDLKSLERQLEEVREREITFLNSLLWDMLPSDPRYSVIHKRIEQLKEKGDELHR